MCQVYNTIGSLNAIKSHLRHYNICDFKSVKDLITFQNNYLHLRQQIIRDHEVYIQNEKAELNDQILKLKNSIAIKKSESEHYLRWKIESLKKQLDHLSFQTNFTKRLTSYFKKRFLRREIQNNERNASFLIAQLVQSLVDEVEEKNNRLHYITSRFSDAVEQSCSVQLVELKKKKAIVDEINSSIYGAIGEQKVVRELEKLSNDYILINDFALSFSKPIYNQQENEYIKSIQIDHLLISRSGIFLIETKNWSRRSLDNWQLRSPVQQIKRANFALFRIVTAGITTNNLSLNQHHWGDRKVPIRNLIVLTNTRPAEEFQHVKVLTLNELISYVKYFKPTFSAHETDEIANYLVSLNRESIFT